MDPAEYLADDYDISKLTVPKIRSILVDHEVNFPSNANKSALIELFYSQVKPHKDSSVIGKKVKSTSTSSDENQENNSQSLLTPMVITEKIIPSKRRSVSEKPEETKTKKIRKYQNESFSDSTTDSIFENLNNENVDIYNVTDTKYKKKPLNAEQLLAKIDQSTPGSSILKRNTLRSTPSKNSSPDTIVISQKYKVNKVDKDNDINSCEDKISPSRSRSDIFFDNQRDEIILIDDDDSPNSFEVVNGQNPEKQFEVGVSDTTPNIILEGPTSSIKDSIVISSSGDDDDFEMKGGVERLLSDEINNASNQEILDTIAIKNEVKPLIDENHKKIEIADRKSPVNHERNEVQTQMVDDDSTSATIVTSGKQNEELTAEILDQSMNASSGFVKRLLKFLFIVFVTFDILSVLLIISSFREVRMNIGYCNVESPERKINIMQYMPNLLQNRLSPFSSQIKYFESIIVDVASKDCKECPDHAICKLNQLECEYGYRKVKSLKSLFGLVPLEEYCEYDFLKEEQNHYLINYTLELLHKNNGKLPLNELRNYLIEFKPSTMTLEEFEDFWTEFLEKDIKDFEIDRSLKTKEIISHKTPSEFYTRGFGTDNRTKKLFGGSYGLPTTK